MSKHTPNASSTGHWEASEMTTVEWLHSLIDKLAHEKRTDTELVMRQRDNLLAAAEMLLAEQDLSIGCDICGLRTNHHNDAPCGKLEAAVAAAKGVSQ